jgi:hypothetical protein
MDALQTVPTIARDLQDAMGLDTQGCQPTNESYEERAVAGVKGNVEKDVLPDRKSWRGHRVDECPDQRR